MRSDYYELIKTHQISDILSEITILPYSSKQRILETLLKKYPVQYINMALNRYLKEYIKIDRVDIFRLKNLLIYFCEEFKNFYEPTQI